MPAKKNDTKATQRPTERAVLVTTKHRGVFFGYLKTNEAPARVVLLRVRNVVYYPSEAHGFIGLAANGPPDGSRIGPAAPDGELFDITGILGCTDAAVSMFEGEPWR